MLGEVEGMSCNLDSEATTEKVGLEPDLLGEPSRQWEQHVQRPRGGTC